MTTLLVRPEGPQFYKTIGPDLGFGYLETALAKAGRATRIVDLMKTSERELANTAATGRFDLIGFKLYSKDANAFRRLVGLIPHARSGEGHVPIAIGGPLPTGLGARCLELFPEADYAFAGESERALPMLLDHLSGGGVALSSIPGLIYRDAGEVRANPQEFPQDLDALGFPEFRQMPPARYPMDYTGHVYVPMVTTRGCPYRCTYCGGPLNNGHRLRRRSADHVIEEMRRLKAGYGVTMVSVVDDNFTMNPTHAREVLTKLIESGLGLAWRAPNGIRLDTLDRGLVELMERSGCQELYLGVESGSPAVLDDMKRRVTVETYREKVALLARHSRIRLLGFFMLGYPTETESDAKMTVDLACELPIHRAAFFFFTPHPGTEIYDEMRARNEIGDDIWDSLFYDKPTLGSRHIPLRRLRTIQRRAYLRFYLRPRIVGHLMTLARGPRQFARLARKIAGTALGV